MRMVYVSVVLILSMPSARADYQSDACARANRAFAEAARQVEQKVDPLPDVDAIDRFTQINNDCPQARAVAQRALAEARLGRFTDARRHLKEALASTADPDVNEKRAELELNLAQVERLLSRVKVVGGAPGAKVKLDGLPVGSLPLPESLFAMPGHHRVEVIAAGAPGFAHEFSTVAEQTVTVEAPTPEVTPPPPAEPAPKPSLSLRRQLAYAGLPVAAVFLAGGAIAGSYWNPVIRHWNNECLVPINMTRAMNCPDGSRDVQLTMAFTITGFVVGGAVAVASLAALLVPERQDAPRRTAALSCGAGPGVVGVACGGSF